MPILIFGEIFEAIFAQQSSGQRTMGVWAKKVGGLGKERGDLGKDGLTSPGPSTSYRCEFKASGVAEEQWRKAWRTRAGSQPRGWGPWQGGAGGGGAERLGRAGRVGGRAGVLETSEICPKSYKLFRIKNARGFDLSAKKEGGCASKEKGGLGKECILRSKSEFCGIEKSIIHVYNVRHNYKSGNSRQMEGSKRQKYIEHHQQQRHAFAPMVVNFVGQLYRQYGLDCLNFLWLTEDHAAQLGKVGPKHSLVLVWMMSIIIVGTSTSVTPLIHSKLSIIGE